MRADAAGSDGQPLRVGIAFDRIDDVIAQIARVKEAEAAMEAKVKDGLVTPDKIAAILASDRVRYVD